MKGIFMKTALHFLVLLAFFLGCAPKQNVEVAVPLYSGLDTFQRTINTTSKEAQQYFDQGFSLYFGFNHEAAIASFQQAVAFDSTAPMPRWGQALSFGPNINNPLMDSAASRNAWDALQMAIRLADNGTPVERDLIDALRVRYAWPPPEDRKHLDTAYAMAMRKVYAKYPKDVDVAALTAESLMNLRPWDLWTPSGQPQPETMEIVGIIEKGLAQVPDHPGLCHFYIHTVEASPEPGKALEAANRLRNRVPGGGHLVHMPSHIDIRLGHYENAIVANEKGIIADTTWVKAGGFYTFYRIHNYHFLAYASMFDGQKAKAMKAARDMVEQAPLELVRAYADYLEAFLAVPIHVMVRFGLWEEILAEPKPPEDLISAVAFWHYGRTVAYAAMGKVKEASEEFAAMKKAYDAVPESRLLANNPLRTVIEVGLPLAEGELEYRKGNYKKAFDLIRLAVMRDDSLRYDEPWGWMMPVRHALGALLLEQNMIDEAEAVYRKDLELHPNNGWALKGLAECLHKKEQHAEAMKTDSLFALSWKRSDITLMASCFCRTGNLEEKTH